MFGQGRGGLLVGGGQLATVLVAPAGQLADVLVLVLGDGGALARLGGGDLEAVHLLTGGRAAAVGRADLLAQPGHPARAGGGGLGALGQPALGPGQLGLGGGALGARGRQHLAARGQPLVQALFFLAQLVGLAVELVGVAAGAVRLGRGLGQQGVPLGGQVLGAAEPLGQGRQGEPGLLGPGQDGRGLLGGLVELVLARPGSADFGLQGGAAGEHGGLVGLVPGQVGGERDVVVGQQPQPGVAQLGLDDGGLPGHLGLAAQRLEAAAQLGGQVDQPGQVGLHRLQLPQRLLLALAVLEDAGRLLDQGAPGLGAGVQDVVELALPDDHVHLAAQAGVGQQVLDVEQPAAVAVDGVLALPRPEHEAADRHLGVLDRQRAVRVVDGERDLGPAQRGA